jgi:cytoskeleton protein RodZ
MSEENLAADPVGDQSPAENGGMPDKVEVNVGLQLRVARESKGISVEEVASVLKLSPRQVEALEANDWSGLPKTIIRGFVRNYARFIGLDVVSLMATLDGMALPQGPELRVQTGSPVSMPKEGGADRKDYARVFSGLVVLLLAILAYYLVPAEAWRTTMSSIKELVQTDRKKNEPAADPDKDVGAESSTVEVVPSPVSTPVPAPTSVVDSPESPVVQQASQPVSAPLSQELAEPVAVAARASGNALVFAFSEPSWVEVRDRSGQVIFSQLSQAGSTREVSGQPPFSLVVGNASHVSVQYRGKPVDLSKRSKDDVARLTLE